MKYFVVLITLLISKLCPAQEHLEPVDSVYSRLPVLIEYHLFVTRAFRAAHDQNVLLKVVILPSFYPESVLYIEKRQSTYSLVHLEAEQQYWLIYDDKPDVTPTEKCRIDIENSFATDLEKIWHTELFNTKHSREFRLGMDGTSYYFSTPIKQLSQGNSLPRMTGEIWSPEENTRMALLENLVLVLVNYCTDGKNLQNMKKSVHDLLPE